ncbi:SPFH domain-containing protein [Candidatus Sulfidibacterium hydrothermale]|uniref:SPFH domain-containing protein n=1 Tax=Candidatus Sulfidibacterium hydrothermale TaxID=2875962 RepID=UPI001F0B1E52|nr:SPFH domain-containing protein [Candidatus Sulfidibacterium hydrothermale]UBM63232.1 SPFH domain-containing protein [Candidatus Sulfidibacterium hydrothermale]
MKEEKLFKPVSGYLALVIVLVLIGIPVWAVATGQMLWTILLGIIGLFLLPGFTVVNPNESKVLTLFGAYKGTIKDNGFWWTNPFFVKKGISLRARNLDSEPIKVNDKLGNPVMIGVVMVWRVKDTYKAAFDVDDYTMFVDIQNEAAIRKLAGRYPYDNLEDENAHLTLRSSSDEVNEMLEQEITERLAIAGIEVMEARINYLAYAKEIAGAMLKRQQASAIVAARTKIVEGAVGMVEMALDELSKKQIIELDEEKKAAMVSNLMVVLTSDKDISPVVNTGTLYQ